MPEIRRETLDVAALQPGESVLDVGCGTGTLTLGAARRVGPGARVSGIDASPDMIATARRKAEKQGVATDFRLAAVEELPFEKAEFDVVLSSLMLHHLPDDVKLQGLAEISRVLKPGGRLVAVDLGARGLHIMGLIGHRMPKDYGERLKAMTARAGFESVELVATRFKQLVFLRARTPAAVGERSNP